MIRNKRFIYILAAGMFLVSATGCKKYLDVNKNVNDPTKVPVSTLLTGAQLAIGSNLSMGGLSNGLSVYTHQHSTREEPNEYGMLGNDFIVTTAWAGLYAALTDLDVIISQATAEQRIKYRGIAKILKAYTFSQMVDVWGDIPFSEFNRFKEGFKQPKFDDDATIYPQLFTLLNEGIADIKNPILNPTSPGADDVIYKGNLTNWEKAANTIKLKLYTQIRRVQNVSAEVTALLASPSTLINSNAESFMLPFGPLGATDDRNPGFADYTAGQRTQHVSPWLYSIMKGYDVGGYTTINSGVADPRLNYYIYNQIGPTTAAASATEYRDGSFISLYFGSVGVNRNANQQTSISLWGIYPVGGRYNDGTPQTASSASGTGAAPYRFITYADRLYLEAELINTGVIAGDARTVFQNAMTASMSMVDYVITNFVKPSQTVPALVGAATTTYINDILAKYDAGTTAKKLEHIITQKWLQSMGSAVDQYTDYRRTGYPVLFDPRNTTMAPGGLVQPPVAGNPFVNPQAAVPVQQGVEFPLSLPWSTNELQLNGNAPAQKTPSTFKVFWIP